jgi:gamma-butyrobetaine dioxygenase
MPLSIGRDGVMERINYSVPQRDSTFTVPLEKVVRWYEAKAKFVELIHQESVAFKTQPGKTVNSIYQCVYYSANSYFLPWPGDILTFDNIRMVHGRTGYTDQINNTRYIVGAYLDWDEIYSKLRVLK